MAKRTRAKKGRDLQRLLLSRFISTSTRLRPLRISFPTISEPGTGYEISRYKNGANFPKSVKGDRRQYAKYFKIVKKNTGFKEEALITLMSRASIYVLQHVFNYDMSFCSFSFFQSGLLHSFNGFVVRTLRQRVLCGRNS